MPATRAAATARRAIHASTMSSGLGGHPGDVARRQWETGGRIGERRCGARMGRDRGAPGDGGGAATRGGSRSRRPRDAPRRPGADLVPACFAIEATALAIPIDSVKPKGSTALGRIRNLERDPRATLLVEHWDAADWSRLWWVRLLLRPRRPRRPTPWNRSRPGSARRYPQYATARFVEILTFRIEHVGGWAAGGCRAGSGGGRRCPRTTWTACQQNSATTLRCGRNSSPSASSAFGWQELRLLVDQAPAVPHAEVVDGPDVRPPELEQQEHLGRPPADARGPSSAGRRSRRPRARSSPSKRHGAVGDLRPPGRGASASSPSTGPPRGAPRARWRESPRPSPRRRWPPRTAGGSPPRPGSPAAGRRSPGRATRADRPRRGRGLRARRRDERTRRASGRRQRPPPIAGVEVEGHRPTG